MLSRAQILDLLPTQLRAELSSYPLQDQEALFNNVRTIVAKLEGKEGSFFQRRVVPLIQSGLKPRDALSVARKANPQEFSRDLKARLDGPLSRANTRSAPSQNLRAGGESVPQSAFYDRRVAPLIKAGVNRAEALSAARRKYSSEYNAEQIAKHSR